MSTPTPPSQGPWRVLGGPLGTHTSARSRSVAARASLAVALVAIPVLVAIALRGWCLVNGFTGQVPLWRACYSDLPAMLQALKSGGQTGDPLVTRTVLRLLAVVVPGSEATGQSAFVLLWAAMALLLLAVCAVAVTVYSSDLLLEGSDRALLLVLCPALPLGLLISGDLVGVTLMTVGLLALLLGREATAGVLLALAVFSRSIALIVVIAIVVQELVPQPRRGSGPRLRRLATGFAGGVVATLVVGVSVGATSLTRPITQWWQAAPGYGSVWVLPQVAESSPPATTGDWLRRLVGAAVPPDGLMPWVALGGWVLAIGLVGWLAARSWGRPTLPDLALLGVCVVFVTAPALPVQASLWLVPLVALSTLRWRDMLIWAGAEVLYFPMVWLYLGGLENPSRGLPAGWYAIFLLIRLLAIAYLGWRVAENSRFVPPWARAGDASF